MEELIREPAPILKINIIEPEWDHFDRVENKRSQHLKITLIVLQEAYS